jgi:hypothetical protein
MIKRSVIVVLILFLFAGCGKSEQEQANEVTDNPVDALVVVSFDPPLPAKLNVEEKLMITVDYSIASVDTAQIWARPYTKGKLSQAYFAHPSPAYGKGKGRIVGWFGFDDPAIVDAVLVKMVADGENILALVKPIDAEWEKP